MQQHSQNQGQACLRQGGTQVKLRSKRAWVPTNTTWEQANIHSEKKTRGVAAAPPPSTHAHNNINTMSKLQNYKPHVWCKLKVQWFYGKEQAAGVQWKSGGKNQGLMLLMLLLLLLHTSQLLWVRRINLYGMEGILASEEGKAKRESQSECVHC